jgi:hypothetical protein
LDISPIYGDEEHITGYSDTAITAYDHTTPKIKTSTDYYSHIMLKPASPDFRVVCTFNEE